jgi:pyruvate kinase
VTASLDLERWGAGRSSSARTGRTARILSALRPRVPNVAFSPEPTVGARLALVHGVVPLSCIPPPDTAARLGLMGWLIGESRIIAPAGAVVLVASAAAAGSGPNLLEVHRVQG